MSLEINKANRCPYCFRTMMLNYHFDATEIGKDLVDTQECSWCRKPMVFVWRMTVKLKAHRVEGFFGKLAARLKRG